MYPVWTVATWRVILLDSSAPGCGNRRTKKSSRRRFWPGCQDTVRILRGLTRENAALAELDSLLEKAPSSLRAAYALLQTAAVQAARIAATLANKEGEESKTWFSRSKAKLRGAFGRHAFTCASWLALPSVKLDGKLAQLDQAPTLRKISKFEESLCPLIEATLQNLQTNSTSSRLEDQKSLAELSRCLREAGDHARQRLLALETLAGQCDDLAAMDFTFLFDPARDLFYQRVLTSPTGGVTQATTICWLRKRVCAATSPSHWGRFRKITGSQWAACLVASRGETRAHFV